MDENVVEAIEDGLTRNVRTLYEYVNFVEIYSEQFVPWNFL